MADQSTPSIFSKENYRLMLIGVLIITIGMFVMSGGKSSDPSISNTVGAYTTRRITIAPLMILLGIAIEIYAIFKKPKVNEG